MLERFDKASGEVVTKAREEARLLGAAKLEAEHLLLALSMKPASDAGEVLAAEGLDHDGLTRALEAEHVRSLEAAGVAVGGIGLRERPVPSAGQPRWGASSKRAIERALLVVKERGGRRILPAHILLGVLRAEEGTVPRALAEAGVDPARLAAAAEATL